MNTINDRDYIQAYLEDLEKKKTFAKNTLVYKKSLLMKFSKQMPDGEVEEKDLIEIYNGNRYLKRRTIIALKSEICEYYKWLNMNFVKLLNLDWQKDISFILKTKNRIERLLSVDIPKEIGQKRVFKEKINLEDLINLLNSEDVEVHEKILFYVLAYFGLRITELYYLLESTEKDNTYFIDFQNNHVHIGKTKTEAGTRDLFFDDYTKKVLKAFIEFYKYKLSYGRGNPKITKKKINLFDPKISQKKRHKLFLNKAYNICKKAEKKYKIKHATNPHAFRSLFSTMMEIAITKSETTFEHAGYKIKFTEAQLRQVFQYFMMGHEIKQIGIDHTGMSYFTTNKEELKKLMLENHYFKKYNIKIKEVV